MNMRGTMSLAGSKRTANGKGFSGDVILFINCSAKT